MFYDIPQQLACNHLHHAHDCNDDHVRDGDHVHDCDRGDDDPTDSDALFVYYRSY